METHHQSPEDGSKSLAIDKSRVLPKRQRAMSMSGAEGVVRDISPLSTWLTTETRVRDFGNTPPASPSAPKVDNATILRLARNRRLNVGKSLATSALDSAGIPENDSARRNIINRKRPAVRRYTGLPPNLTPTYCGRHPIPYTMPDRQTLGKIFHPLLADLIKNSNYPQLAPNRCFCSLVLHELQMRETRYWLDIYGPSSHADLQFQLRTMLTSDERTVTRILWHYGDALKMHVHAKRNGRPMKYDTWAEYVGLLCEDVFTCGPHPLLADGPAPTGNSTQVADKDATEKMQAPVEASENVNVQDLVEETVTETVEDAVDDSIRETVRGILLETIREIVRETVENMGAQPNSERPVEKTSGERKKGSMRKSLFQCMHKLSGLKKKKANPSTKPR